MPENIDDDSVEQFIKTQKAGQEYIYKAWKQLREKTRQSFITTGFYDKRGVRLKPEDDPFDNLTDLENFEYQVGVLKMCAEDRLPSRTDVNVIISYEAANDEILHACSNILFYVKWLDPSFYRLALRAIRINQMAKLMLRLPVQKQNSHFLLKSFGVMALGLLDMVLILASPYTLAVALTSVSKGDVTGASSAFYFLGFTVWLYFFVKNFSEGKMTDDEKAFISWEKLTYSSSSTGPWLENGTGAKIYFEKISKEGVAVPLIVFDLCGALELSSIG